MKFKNGVTPRIPILNDQTFPGFLAAPRLQDLGSRHDPRLRIFSRTASTRRVCFKKRCSGLLKKTAELSTLCGVEACAIVYGTDGCSTGPEVWPSDAGVRQTMGRFLALPDFGKGGKKTMMNQEKFLGEEVWKLHGIVERHQRENQDLETNMLMLDGLAGMPLPTMGIEDVFDLLRLIETRSEEVNGRIQALKEAQTTTLAAEAAVPTNAVMTMETLIEMMEPEEEEEPIDKCKLGAKMTEMMETAGMCETPSQPSWLTEVETVATSEAPSQPSWLTETVGTCEMPSQPSWLTEMEGSLIDDPWLISPEMGGEWYY